MKSNEATPRTLSSVSATWSFLLVLALTVTVTSCESSKDRDAPALEVIRIVAIAESLDDPTWGALNAARLRVKEQLGTPCSLLIVAPQTASPREQQRLLEQIRADEVDALCIAPTDPEAIRRFVDDLTQAGVPVVTLGRDIPGSLRVVHSGPSDVEIGRAAVRAGAEVIKAGTTSVMLLHAGSDDPAYGQRYAGFMQDLPMYPELKLLREVDCAQNRGDALRLVRWESRKYPRAGCWVFLDDWPLRALADNERLLTTDSRVVVCNASPRYFPRLRNGQISALVGYDYEEAAYRALIAALNLAKDRQGKVTVPPAAARIITVKNLPGFEKRPPAATNPSSAG